MRSSVVCVEKGKMLGVRLLDPATQKIYLFPPGGKIEEGESPAQTAEREIREETGYDVEVLMAGKSELRYPFQWNGKEHDCLTHFFKGRLRTPTPVGAPDPKWLVRVEWVLVSSLWEELKFHPPMRDVILRLCQA